MERSSPGLSDSRFRFDAGPDGSVRFYSKGPKPTCRWRVHLTPQNEVDSRLTRFFRPREVRECDRTKPRNPSGWRSTPVRPPGGPEHSLEVQVEALQRYTRRQCREAVRAYFESRRPRPVRRNDGRSHQG